MKLAPLALVLLTACMATTPAPTYTSDGQKAFYVECRHSMTYCYDAAREQCPGGYVPVSQGQQASIIGLPQPSGGTLMAPIRIAELTFRCN